MKEIGRNNTEPKYFDLERDIIAYYYHDFDI